MALQSLFNTTPQTSGQYPWQQPQTPAKKTISPVVQQPETQLASPTMATQNSFSGTAPELDWGTFEQQLLNPYISQGYLNVGDDRSQWASQLGLDVGGKPTLGLSLNGQQWSPQTGNTIGADGQSIAVAPGDAGKYQYYDPVNMLYSNSMDGPKIGDGGYEANKYYGKTSQQMMADYLNNPETIYSLGTDRIGAGGVNAGGGRSRTEVQYKRVGDKLVPIYQRDFDKGSLTQDALKGAIALAGAVYGIQGLEGMMGGSGVGGLSGMDLAADAALGTGNNIMTAGAGLGSAGAGIPAFSQLPGYGQEVATLADSSGLSPFTGGSSASTGADSLASYMTTGASEGSTMGGALVGGGGAGAVGNGTLAGALGTLANNPITSQIGKTVGGNIAQDLIGKVLGGGAGGISNLGNLASLFTNYNQYNKMGDLINEIKSIYKPDGEYAKYMENQLGRRDAAAGRNSQYGPRLSELMGRLGDSQARALSGLGGMMATQQGGLNGMVGAGGRLAGGMGLGDLLSGLLGGGGGMSVGELGTTPSDWDRPAEDIDWEALFGG